MALELFAKTQAVEMDGGMMIKNGARRRTPGGVYLHLLRGLKDPRVDVKEVTWTGFSSLYSYVKKCQLYLTGWFSVIWAEKLGYLYETLLFFNLCYI